MLRDWLKEALKHSGLSQAELARQLSDVLPKAIDRAAVNKMTKGTRQIAADELLAIVNITGYQQPETKLEDGGALSIASEVRPLLRTLIQVPTVGKAEAGLFREVIEYDDEEPRMIFVEQDPDFPQARVFGLEISGDSMNAAEPPLLPGSIAVCVDFDETGLPLETGMIVAVERTMNDGLAREWSVKQVEFFDDRVEYHPRSTNPRHKAIVVPHDAEADDGVVVRVLGLVRSSINPVPVSFARR